jgi:hypothetical protein
VRQYFSSSCVQGTLCIPTCASYFFSRWQTLLSRWLFWRVPDAAAPARTQPTAMQDPERRAPRMGAATQRPLSSMARRRTPPAMEAVFSDLRGAAHCAQAQQIARPVRCAAKPTIKEPASPIRRSAALGSLNLTRPNSAKSPANASGPAKPATALTASLSDMRPRRMGRPRVDIPQ